MKPLCTASARSALLFALTLALLLAGAPVQAQTAACPMPPPTADGRLLAVISDLHMGLGRGVDGTWDPKEDFRWHGALSGFLQRVATCGGDRVDLVVAGDLLELWQPPARVACKGAGPDLGCTPQELAEITRAIVRAHAPTFRALGRFADRGANRLVLIPGNHDAALLLPEPWRLVQEAIAARPGRLERSDSGVYTWDAGRVVVEHGQQIGSDVNRYAAWPEITRQQAGQTFVVRPWGELFVQRLFNAQERNYPVIDNLAPEAAGARYRMADRGLWSSAADMARFIAFNLFETSAGQKVDALGGGPGQAGPHWDLVQGRGLGHRLFAEALAEADPFRAALLEPGPQGQALRMELDTLARDATRLPDADVQALCDQIAVRGIDGTGCSKATLGALLSGVVNSKRAVLAEHLAQRLKEPATQAMRVFVYGHTHALEQAWEVQATDLRRVTVLNSGAFQRIVDEDGFLRRAREKGWTPAEALRRLSVDGLAPCYTAVFAAAGTLPAAETLRWHQPEGGTGRFVEVGNQACR